MAAPWEMPAAPASAPTAAKSTPAPWEMTAPATPPPPTPPTPGTFGGLIDVAKNAGTAVEGGLARIAGFPGAAVGQLSQDAQQYAPNLFKPEGLPALSNNVWGDRGKLAAVLANIQSRQANLPPVDQDTRSFGEKFMLPNPGAPSSDLAPTTAGTRDFIVKGGDINLPFFGNVAHFRGTGLDYVPSTPAGRIFQKGAEMAMAAVPGGVGAGLRGLTTAGLLGDVGGTAQQGAKELGLPEGAQNLLGIAVPMLAGGALAGTRALMRPTTPGGQMTAAQRVLDEAATNKDAAIGSPPIPGTPSTLGQATNDEGLKAFEKGRFNTAGPDKVYADISKGANEATVSSLQGGLGTNWPGRGQAVQQAQNASADMHQAVTDALAAAKTKQTNAWQAVDPTQSTALDTAPMKGAVSNYVSGLTVARQRFLPKPILDMIGSLGPQVPLRELQDLRSALTTQARGLKQAGSLNEANAVGGLASVVGQHVDSLTFADPAVDAAYRGARQTSVDLHNIFDKKPIEQMLADNPSQAARHAMRTREGFDAYYKATGGDPAAMQHARDYFAAGLAGAAEAKGAEVQKLLAGPYQDYLKNNQTLLNDNRLFTPDQRKVINDAAAQLDYSLRTERAGMKGQSPTANLMSQQRYAEALVGKGGAAFANLIGKAKTATGAIIGHHFGGPAGMLVGGVMGHATGVPYAEAAKAVMGLVDRAIADPAFAAELRKFREKPNYKTMTPNIQNLFRPSQYPMIMPPATPKAP